MDINKLKNAVFSAFSRIKKNLRGKELTEGQKYIRNANKGNRFKDRKGSTHNFGASENKLFKEPKPRMLVGIGPGFIGYVIFFFFAIIFTQALQSPISAMMMVFAITWIAVSVIYLIIMFGSIDSFIEHKGADVFKNTETEFQIKLVNHSFLPAPFLEADLRLPEKNSLRCVRKRVKVAMHGSGDYTINRKVSFGYRGTYDVGVDTVTAYDFFRIFRVNIRLYNYRSIYVMPRHFTLDTRRAYATSDSQTEIRKNVYGIERSDVAEIRAYIPGDQMKNIHWKLSSKSDDLQVKHYSMNSGKTVYIFCDMKGHFDPHKDSSYDVDINEYAVDGTVELAVAAASREMSDGNKCIIVWQDERVDGGIQMYSCNDSEEFANVLKLFSTAPVYRGNSSVTDLTSLITESQNTSMLFVTANIDSDFVSGVRRSSILVGGVGASGIEVYYFNPKERIHEKSIKELHDGFIDRCKTALTEDNIEVIETTAELSGHLTL